MKDRTAQQVVEKMGARALEIFEGAREFGACLASLAAAKIERAKAREVAQTLRQTLSEGRGEVVARVTAAQAARSQIAFEFGAAVLVARDAAHAEWVALPAPKEWHHRDKAVRLAVEALRGEWQPKLDAALAEAAAATEALAAYDARAERAIHRADKTARRWDGIVDYCRAWRDGWARYDGPKVYSGCALDVIVRGY